MGDELVFHIPDLTDRTNAIGVDGGPTTAS